MVSATPDLADSYAYQIAKYETAIAQDAGFLNAVAATDTYSLYSASMTTRDINGIGRSGVAGSFTSWVNPGNANKPITSNEAIEMTRWVVRMASDSKLLAPKQFELSAFRLNECGRMVGGWLKSRTSTNSPP